ncbi:putative FAD-dependent oxidoreductase [Advenella mimigardefordensis DPN7]|uniref:Putative FAD-dependent oxidoreductase n=2 Tax=Advenella mimigardefordensis TaxID=302406 RepID=W0PEB9_ADVMD|nr:putative FAD-dependent oxidoreductase [Advenella mimigardefordensis DPN7]
MSMLDFGIQSKSNLIAQLLQVVGTEGVITGESDKRAYEIDWLNKWSGHSSLVVRPANTQQTAEVMRICHANRTPVVVQGGNTGMSGGATPDDSGAQVVLSMTRMNTIREVDSFNNTITVESGVLLAHIQEEAERNNRFFPLSLGSEGSCTIGGNLATNAGGVAVLRYGNTRELTLGIEVVLPDGRIWNGLRALRKDNTGYDLRDLFIGSEGTLGVITAAVLKLHPLPTARSTAWVGAKDIQSLVRLIDACRSRCGERLCAFEMMTHESVALVLQHVTDVSYPLTSDHPVHALIELADMNQEGLANMLESTLEEALDNGDISDAVISASLRQRQNFWKIREGISQAQVRAGKTIKHDIALPISAISDFVSAATAAIGKEQSNARIINFGHIGDGNLHFNVLMPAETDYATMTRNTASLNRVVHDLVHQANGSISAEHGVGQLRRDELRHYKSAVELDLMMCIKQSLDPHQIMNPGKLI